MEIDVSSDPEAPDVRKWTVPAGYRSKSDAKLAVCYLAVSQGAIEVLQFRGASPPPDHTPYWDVVHGKGPGPRVAKRKSAEVELAGEARNQSKKRRKEGKKVESSVLSNNGGRSASAAQNSSNETPAVPKRIGEKRPLKTCLQDLNGSPAYESFNGPAGGRQQAMNVNAGAQQSTDIFPVPQAPYYPPANLPPPHYPYSSPTSTASPMYYQSPTQSPIAFPTYHPHSTMPDQMISHPPPMYHPQAFIPAYPQPAVSPYYTMPSPYHSPYGYGSPMYLPPTPDGRMMDYRQPEMYHSPLPQVPLYPMSPPSTPLRPQRIKRIDRNAAFSPLKMADDSFAELEELGTGNMEKLLSKAINGSSGTEKVLGGESREKEGLEPGELREGEEEEVVSKRHHQVLERRASIP